MDTYYIYEIDNYNYLIYIFDLGSSFLYSDYIVYNKFGQKYTFYNSKYYVLIKKNNYSFSISYLYYPISFYSTYINWRDQWIRKRDYIYNYYLTIKGKYNIIDESISYYLTLFDYSIYLLKDFSFDGLVSIQHNKMNIDDYFNPFNLRLDYRERDFAEYLKGIFFSNEYKNIDYKSIINRGIGIFRYELVISRMIFPSYYFDLFDNIVLNNKEQSILNEILNRQSEYNNYIKNIINIVDKKKKKKVPF